MLIIITCGCLLLLSHGEGARGQLAAPSFLHTSDLASPSRVVSLCGKDESIVFSCTIKGSGKLLSICSSRQLDASKGYVQYRFGRPGGVELEFPKARENTQAAFRYVRYTRPLVTYLALRFETGGYLYSVHQDSDDEQKPRAQDARVTVTPIGTQTGKPHEIELQCRMPIEGSLMKLEDVVITRPWPDEGPTSP